MADREQQATTSVSFALLLSVSASNTHGHECACVSTMVVFAIHAFLKPQILRGVGRCFATKVKYRSPDTKLGPAVDTSSTSSKGFLRPQKSYAPPNDLNQRFSQITQQILGSQNKIPDLKKKFALLVACETEFQHSVPNSLLHTLETIQDVLEFYKTPVDNRVPLELMNNVDLPENVHIQFDYHRFHPETDALFDGVTAFPKSSTLVTGLKYRDKYRGYEARTSWPYNT